ncbi:MAG: MBL fold metallo-hydrolase [Halobacteriovorax sp.]|nr:MBL fold metallo-hydrolase [Halobacteriovorax sp.]|tara:strand:- start:41721 stop:42590 length:870 start_codon:yes stop_codon:yes gene_type:complete
MANLRNKRNKNAEGNFFVDNSCIDCGTCYWMAPQVFKEDDGMSLVYEQPKPNQEVRAMEALFSCPTNSIGYTGARVEMRKISKTFPIPVSENVFHNGYHSESSYGAASYFIQRDNGNVLVDSPRYSSVISKNIKDMGGVVLQYLTHRDDVADTDLYQKDFLSKRLMHKDDISKKTEHFEIILDGQEDYQIDDDLLVITVPGHTKGHTVLLYKEKYLFTGDHLAFQRHQKHLYAFKTACWYDWDIQIKSMEKLLNYNFSHVLPGHGAPYKANSSADMKLELEKCIEWMKS